MILVLIGPPGAGKGTQCKRLVEKYGLKHLSSGDIFRSEMASGTKIGLTAKGFIDAGQLVPDDVVIDMMTNAVENAGSCILDGFPRTVNQARSLDNALDKKNNSINAVVLLVVADDNVASRLTGRRVCLNCGATYHLEYSRPATEGICDHCSKPLVHRDDDKIEVITKRLATYHKQTEPIVDYYRSSGKNVLMIDADGDIDKITESIVFKIDNI